MAPTLNVKGAESGTARVLGSGLSGECHARAYGICTRLNEAFAGVAELVVFHPVDTIAKRLMSNKSKVRQSSRVAHFGAGLTAHPVHRSLLRRSQLSSSANTRLRRLASVFCRCFPVSATRLATRSPSAFTSTEASHGSATSSRGTTRASSRTRLVRGRASS